MKKGFIFDLDGTVYLDNKLIDGSADAIKTLKERGDKVIFLTNKSIESISNYVTKLSELGIETSYNEVVNSNLLTARYLKSQLKKDEKVMVIGEQPLIDELINQQIVITDDHNEAAFVVLGWDRDFTYNKLNSAFQAWRKGAKVVATNPDRTCPVYGGQVPDCGAMIGAIEGATGEKIEPVIGKPSKFAAHFIVTELFKLPPENCFMVGDRLETDIKMGNEYGLQSVLVLTGVTDENLLKKSIYKPKVILESVKDIVNL
ncbi:HAD-IIA family hydrolase [Lentibacillus salinarum]|uniref:Acid sugar phosphatase n=1 Tax=Lentibacillus salinarum TaxID=446820 RepID=A0ABW3ZZ39_9BACI